MRVIGLAVVFTVLLVFTPKTVAFDDFPVALQQRKPFAP